MNGLYWLASYPKSGNTWFRIVLAKLLSHAASLDYINHMNQILGSTFAVSRAWMDQLLGFDSLLLTDDEIDRLRPIAYQYAAKAFERTTYNKIHDAYTYLEDGNPLLPVDGCLGAVYFVRNPLDVAVSLAHYINAPIAHSITTLANDDFVIPVKSQGTKQLRQKILSWSSHVKSWLHVKDIPLLIIRYEDMLASPFDTFQNGLKFLNLQFSDAALQEAIDLTAFDKLQHHEHQFGFIEKPHAASSFFRKGKVGDWENVLTEGQIHKIVCDHREMMQHCGYLDASGKPI